MKFNFIFPIDQHRLEEVYKACGELHNSGIDISIVELLDKALPNILGDKKLIFLSVHPDKKYMSMCEFKNFNIKDKFNRVFQPILELHTPLQCVVLEVEGSDVNYYPINSYEQGCDILSDDVFFKLSDNSEVEYVKEDFIQKVMIGLSKPAEYNLIWVERLICNLKDTVLTSISLDQLPADDDCYHYFEQLILFCNGLMNNRSENEEWIKNITSALSGAATINYSNLQLQKLR